MSLTLLVVALLGVVAIAVGRLAQRFVPEIVVFLALGFAIGPEGPIGLINDRNIAQLNLITQVALAAVIFLIGDRLRFEQLRGRPLLHRANVAQLLLSIGLVVLATWLAGADLQVALVLGLIAAETGVLTVTATVKQERASGPFTDTLLTSVGLTNVVTAALFGLAFPFILASSEASTLGQTTLIFTRLVLLSTVIGLAGGWALRMLSRGVETSGELLLYLLLAITAIAGAAIAVDGSVVVSSLVAGLYVANAAPWLADRLFAAVRVLEAPIYLVFFVVAGAEIHLDQLAAVGTIGAAYVVARTIGKVAGTGAVGLVSGQAAVARRLGLGLLPHAGMAIGLVALVVEQSPTLGGSISGVVLGSIVVFELTGPLFVRRAVRAAGERGQARGDSRLELVPSVIPSRVYHRVLVPVGSVEILLPRLPFLFDLIGTMRAELIAVHVSAPGEPVRGDPEVLRLVRRVADERNVPCTPIHLVSERIAASIVRVAREHEVDLVVMGEPARTSLFEPSRWGMVSQRVVRDVDVPVLVYPVDTLHPEQVPGAYRRAAERASARATKDVPGDPPGAPPG